MSCIFFISENNFGEKLPFLNPLPQHKPACIYLAVGGPYSIECSQWFDHL